MSTKPIHGSNNNRRNRGTLTTTFRHPDGSLASLTLNRSGLKKNSGAVDGRPVNTIYSMEWESNGRKLVAIGTSAGISTGQIPSYPKDDMILFAVNNLGVTAIDNEIETITD